MKLPSDKEVLDRLECFIQSRPLVLWRGDGKFPGGSGIVGISLMSGTRSLREALALVVLAPAVALLWWAWLLWRERPRVEITVSPEEVAAMLERLEEAEK